MLELSHVSFNYKENSVLEDVSFRVEPGDYIGIIGPNGGGKTTLLNIILGLTTPTSGEIKLGIDRSRIGYVPQRLGNIDSNFPGTVYEIICTGRTAIAGLFRTLQKNDIAAINRAMEIARVTDLKDKLINDLSGGQRQRVMIARALASEPKLLLLDEPTTGVDAASQQQFYEFLAELNHKHGLTIMFVSHDIDIIANEVHTLLLLNKRVVRFGPAKDLITKEYLENLYGDKTNFIFHHH